jgi:hypothetical protein
VKTLPLLRVLPLTWLQAPLSPSILTLPMRA